MRTFADAFRGKYAPEEAEVAAAAGDVDVSESSAEQKKWEMVGMAAGRNTSGPSLRRLRVVGLAEEGVEAVGDPAEVAAVGENIVELDLGSSAFSGWAVPAGIAEALPRLQVLDLSGNTLRMPPPPPPAALRRLTRLVLNGTGLSWPDVVAVSAAGGLESLQALHLDKNEMAEVGGGVCLPQLTSLVMACNCLSSWRGVLDAVAALPRLDELVLTANKLPAPTAEEAAEIAASTLSSLSVAENPIQSSEWMLPVGRADRLRALRLTAAPCFGPSIAPQHARLLTIALMRGLATLNVSEIRPRERTEAERYYISRTAGELRRGGLEGEHKDDCSDLPESFHAQHPYYREYVQRHGNPSEQVKPAQAASAGASMAKLTLRGMCAQSEKKPDVVKDLPLAMKVGQLKAVVKAAFGIPPAAQLLVYKYQATSQDLPCELPLDNDMESLVYHGVDKEGVIEVRGR
eukprot:TRINITY_DN30499_c0_g1_i1.p1 TRINITY_DN30499_c0_g1~~TRINITY_DN30499_c0_g1_i1.p1  ORF type:complete len:460 (+),score=188.78 TRINITY_DN30499_c0_g1_i1:77-1456(+)